MGNVPDIDVKMLAAHACLGLGHRNHAGQPFTQFKLCLCQLHFAGFYFGHVQHIVNQSQQ